jgi:catechol 2,3-dioxygenase-like lactoylglutathione lyase family enzyme
VRVGHVALHVPDLQRAEELYCATFGLEVLTREAMRADGTWGQLPPDVGWQQARAAGLEPQMVGLRGDGLVVALFPGSPSPGTLLLIGLDVTEDELAQVSARLPTDATVETATDSALTFQDPFGFRWQLTTTGFRGAGEARGDWIDLQTP